MMNGRDGREAAASAAAAIVKPGMTVGLGSGRMIWRIADLLGRRRIAIQVVVASRRTHTAAHLAGLDIVELDGEITLDVALDGADEMDMDLRLIKGAGGALLREKIVTSAANRFIVVIDAGRIVTHLGERCKLPVEIVKFSWTETRRALMRWTTEPRLRTDTRGKTYVTEDGHYIVDCGLHADNDPDALQDKLLQIPGVVEHGLFTADQALVGHPNGEVESLEAGDQSLAGRSRLPYNQPKAEVPLRGGQRPS